MILLSAENIKRSYSEKILLQEISLYLNQGDKVGVIGINGTGKSTFLKIIAGLEEPDSGTITKSSGVRIGYLPQNPAFEENITVLDQVFRDASSETKELMEYEARIILNKLGITEFDANVSLLSGGEKKRVAIAGTLVNPSEILILDEPTNHLDNEMVLWLENYLKQYTGSILMVTHDRYFLDRVTNRIVEIDKGQLYSYQTNYTKYLELKAQREEMELSTERKNRSLYRKELEWISRGAKARSTKSKERIERFGILRDRDKPTAGEKINLKSPTTRLGKKTIEISGTSKTLNNRPLIQDFSHIILRGERIGIIGRNGCGKSTLLKIITGEVQPDSGTVTIGETVKLGYFSQESEEMDTSLRVIDYIRRISDSIHTGKGTLTASQMLERFLFPADLQWNIIGKLSGGERRRLYLLRVLIEAPNILLLDEPSNDLDIETLTILEDYLEEFEGAVVVVSHDRYFLDKVVDRIFEFREDGTIKQYEGGYSDYLKQRTIESKTDDSRSNRPNETADQKIYTGKQSSKQRQLKFTYKEQLEYEEIEDVIADLEGKLSKLEEAIQSEATNYTRLQELTAEKAEMERILAEKMDRWVYLNDLAERISATK